MCGTCKTTGGRPIVPPTPEEMKAAPDAMLERVLQAATVPMLLEALAGAAAGLEVENAKLKERLARLAVVRIALDVAPNGPEDWRPTPLTDAAYEGEVCTPDEWAKFARGLERKMAIAYESCDNWRADCLKARAELHEHLRICNPVITRLEGQLQRAMHWRPIAEHDGSKRPVLLMGRGNWPFPIVAQRQQPIHLPGLVGDRAVCSWQDVVTHIAIRDCMVTHYAETTNPNDTKEERT